MRQAVVMTVGTKHWAAQADLLLSLESDDATEVDVALGLLSSWIEDWLHLDPIIYMGAQKATASLLHCSTNFLACHPVLTGVL